MEGWLENIRVVFNAATLSPIYIPTVREEWKKAVNQKSPPTSEDPEDPAKQPKKSADPKPVRKPVAKKSSTKQQKSGSKKDDGKDKSQSQAEDPEKQPEGPIDEPDPPHPSKDPEVPQPPEEDPQGPLAKKQNLENQEPNQKVPSQRMMNQMNLYPNVLQVGLLEINLHGIRHKTGVTYDTKKTGPAAVPPENLLDVTRKQKAGCQPKPSTSEGHPASKRKRTAPTRWLPHTQQRTTYMMGDKITPVWGLIHKGSMDPTEDWRVPIYQPPKFIEKQKAAQKEAKKQKQRYKRYKPGQLMLKENKYYKKNAGFIIAISAIRRLCLEIGYDYKEKINFQLHAYRLLQEAAEWYLVRVFKDTNFLAAHVKRITINTKDMVLERKVSGDYGLHNTWAWNPDHLTRPWAYEGKLTKEQRKIRKQYLGSKQDYRKQTWKVRVPKQRERNK